MEQQHTAEQPHNSPLRRVGAMWEPKTGAKSLYSGSFSLKGFKQRFVVVRNDRKQAGSRDPDFLLLSSADPEPDPYAAARPAA